MKKMSITVRLAWSAALLAAVAVSPSLRATPYASEITNNAGTIQFYLNESNAMVVVTFEDGTTSASFDGVTTGTNVLKGMQSFSLGTHSSYQIAVSKTGTGLASLLGIHTVPNTRGVDVNKIKNSPNFGQIYVCASTLSSTNGALRRLNSDLTLVNTNSGGVGWVLSSGSSPYRLAVNDDGYITVGDWASAHSGVWRVDPTLSSNQLVLGPIGDTAGSAANSHGAEFSRPLLIGNLQSGGSAILYTVDAGNFPFNSAQLNSVLVYSNLTLANLPRQTAPDLLGPEVGYNGVVNNNYPGITVGTNGYFYCTDRRDVVGLANVMVFDANFNPLWNSLYNSGANDYFLTSAGGLCDGAASPDGKYFAGLGYADNRIMVVSLTNGVPDPSTLYTIVNSTTATTARGICFDAADNVYVSSSGAGGVQEWSLGLTAKAVTQGDATGQTNFVITMPNTSVSVTATTNLASQSGPTPGTFTLTRTIINPADLNVALTVYYTLTGTASNTSYTVAGGGTTSATFAAGQTNLNIVVTPINDGVSRPTTTVILTLAANGNYSLRAPNTDTVAIQNMGPEYVFISSTPGSTMYKGLTNDFGSFILTRWGDTNNNGNPVTVSSFNYSGAAQPNAQFLPAGPVTFNPGDITVTDTLPIVIDTLSYVGNKSFTVSLGTGTGFTAGTNSSTITILDNVDLPATVLWSDPLTSASDAANWTVAAANYNMATNAIDNTIEFGYDLTSANPESYNNGLISLPPSGATTCLRVTVNKNGAAAGGVNLYPKSASFTGDYAVRFAMNVTEGDNASYTTEGPLFGINHTGLFTNWWTTSILSGWDSAGTNEMWSSDGVWYWMAADGGAAAGDYIEKTGVGGTNYNSGWTTIATASRTSFVGAFKNPGPYSTLNVTTPAAGLPANSSAFNGYALGAGYTNSWADVEIKTVKNKVTLSINKTVIFNYYNTNSVWTNGTFMLGYEDPFSSEGGPDAAVYFSNIRVVRLAGPTITLQPTNLVVGAGSNALFAVAAAFDSSSANTNGQWLLNGTAIPGATNTTYAIASVASTNYGTYAWTVNDGNYVVSSTNVTLLPPHFAISANPLASIVVEANTATNVSVVATTYSGVTNYQWQFNGANRAGAAGPVYNFTSGPTNYGSFTVIVSDGWNTNVSTAAVVTPPVPTILSVLPAAQAAAPGGSAAFKVTAVSHSGLTNYQWLSNKVSIAGATLSTLTLGNLQAGNFGPLYTVRVSDGTTILTSAPPVTLTVASSQAIAGPLLNGTKFSMSFNTEVGPAYVVETATNLAQTNWVPLSTNAGSGSALSVTNTVSGGAQGYYRLRLQ